VLDSARDLLVVNYFPAMRLLSKILWFFAFLAATFVWMVLFEHGFSMQAFSKGFRAEWQALTRMITGAQTEIAPSTSPTPPSKSKP
jgi:hypothetical protein